MKISPLANQIPDYPFIRVARISREVERRDGIPVINARIGIPDMEAPASVKKVMSEFILKERSTYGYPIDVHPERGIPELIEAIIEHYHVCHSVTLKPENILVTGWTKEFLHNITRLFDSGSIQIPDPVYPAYEAATILSNHKIERVRTSVENGWLPEFDFSRQDTVAFYFCDPNNPLGSVADMNYYVSLAEIIKENDIIGIFDVLEHIQEEDKILVNLYKALKPEGYLFVAVPALPYLWSYFDEIAFHKRRYNKNEFINKLKNHGFSIIKATYLFMFLLPVMVLKRKVRLGRLSNQPIDLLKQELSLNPILDAIFYQLIRLESRLIPFLSLPLGSSLLILAKKDNDS